MGLVFMNGKFEFRKGLTGREMGLKRVDHPLSFASRKSIST
jgi:hypothetical protein